MVCQQLFNILYIVSDDGIQYPRIMTAEKAQWLFTNGFYQPYTQGMQGVEGCTVSKKLEKINNT